MTGEFLSVEEIPEKLAEFSNRWFEIVQELEGLSNFKSGFDKGFKSRLKGLLSDDEKCGLLIDNICISSQRHLPAKKGDFEESRKKIVGAFDELRQVFEKDIESLERHESLATKITEIEKRLDAVIKHYEEVKSHALKSCNHYETFKKEYDRKINNIKEATNEKVRAIQKGFMADVKTLFEGYKIFTIEKNDAIGLEVFFERMIKDPEYPEKVNIVPKGLSFGKKKSDIMARVVLLKYKAQDITNELAPILDEESRRIERFQPDLTQLHELEMRCIELRDEEDRLSTMMAGIENNLDALNAEGNDTCRKFQTYESLLELRESYLKTFTSTASFRKELSDLITRSFKEYEPPEPDVEKRELKEDIKRLKQAAAVLNNEKTKILERFEHTKKELGESRAELINRANTIASIEQDRGALKTELEKTSNTLSKTVEELKEKTILLNETENKLLKTANNLEKTLDERDRLTEVRKGLEDRVVKLEDANEKLKTQLRDTADKLEVMIEELREKETAIKELEKLKESTENKLLKTANNLEKTLEERDRLIEAKKGLEDRVVKLEDANEKLKTQLRDAVDKLEVMIEQYEKSRAEVGHHKEKLQEKETAIKELEKLKDSTENKLLKTASNLEKTLDERDRLTETKKELEDANEKLKTQVQDAASKLEVTIEELREKEAAIKELEKLKESTENKLLKTASNLEKTLEERDRLTEVRKGLEGRVAELEEVNKKLKTQAQDAVDKLEVTTEKIQEKETAIKELEKSYGRTVTKQAKTRKRATTTKKAKKVISTQSDRAVVKKKIEALREKKRK